MQMFLGCLCLLVAPYATGMDGGNLREWLIRNFTNEHSNITWENVGSLKEQFAVTDERFHYTLMSIYDKALQLSMPDERDKRARIEAGVVYLLSECGEMPVKDFLLGYASSEGHDAFARELAVASYLRVASAEESKCILLRFLVGDKRMDAIDRNGLYAFAGKIYEDSVSPKKRAAILASIAVAVAREEGKTEFMLADKILAGKSKVYRHSHERLSMLEHFHRQPPSANLNTDRDLKIALIETRKIKSYTNISTNLDTLLAANFDQPLADAEWGFIAIAPQMVPADDLKSEDKLRVAWRLIGRITFGVAIILVLTITCVWLQKYQRKTYKP